MKSKIFTFALLLLMITAAGVWAQNLPANLWTSPQSTATEGRYRSNADDFIRPDAYAGVKFDKWFGMVSFLWDDAYSMIATTGFATKADKVYIGAFYSGNMWAGAPANNYTEQVPGTTPAGGATGKVYNVYNTISTVPGPVNNAAVLIGIADMGFRLTYRTNHQSFNESDVVTGDQLYNDYQSENGYMAPQIAWAMAKDLTKSGIRPYVTVDLVFNRDYQKVDKAGGTSGAEIDHSSNHFDPVFAAGLGGYTFYNKDGFKGSADLDYQLTLNFYDNEYSYQEGGKYKTGTIKGTYSPGLFPYHEKFLMSNLITPSVSGSWSQDRLALKFKLNLPLTFTSSEDNAMDVNASGNLINHGFNDSTFTFVFRPDLRLALQYKLVPNRLTLNTGARIQATALTLETTDRVYYDNGDKKGTQKIHNDNYINIGSGTQFVSRFHIGPTFNFTENAWVEATTGVSNAYGNGAIDVFAPGGLFSFGSILAVLKF
ncbi:MAG: hypothetical protein LBI04_12080 [Treponema sp.]|nr:hypothetical protein [Treponema sp.]